MVKSKRCKSRKRGSALIESALVMVPLFTFVFGVFEYGRLLLDWNLLTNAAREGCRYSLANNTDPTISTDVQNIVTNFMAGRGASFTNFTVTVSGTHQGVATPVNNLVAGDMVTVTVTGTYKFMNIIPLVPMSNSFSLTSSVAMVCEGGT